MDKELLKKYGVPEDFIDYMKSENSAERKVEIINKHYIQGETIAYLPLLAGIEPYVIETRPHAGHNYYLVLDTIHNLYKNNPDGGYDKGFIEGLNALIRVSSAKVGSLDQVLNYIFYQAKKEQSGEAYFSIDLEDAINRVNILIKDNKEKYRKDYPKFDTWFEKIKKYGFENYGVELD